jgi:hypothetical protein
MLSAYSHGCPCRYTCCEEFPGAVLNPSKSAGFFGYACDIKRCLNRHLRYFNILIQLAFRWCPGAELNHRHTDFQSVALPTELPGRLRQQALIEEAIYPCPARHYRAPSGIDRGRSSSPRSTLLLISKSTRIWKPTFNGDTVATRPGPDENVDCLVPSTFGSGSDQSSFGMPIARTPPRCAPRRFW